MSKESRVRRPGVLAGLVLVLLLLLPAACVRAQDLQIEDLVVPASDLGENWSVLEESHEGTSDLALVYSRTYRNEVDDRVATFSLAVRPEVDQAQVVVDGVREGLEAEGFALQTVPGLGDDRAFKGVGAPSTGVVAIAYVFRVDTGAVTVTVAGSATDQEDVELQALTYASFQEERIRSFL